MALMKSPILKEDAEMQFPQITELGKGAYSTDLKQPEGGSDDWTDEDDDTNVIINAFNKD